MNLKIHLVSMPWADVYVPSVQLGALKAHVDQTLPPGQSVATYSAFSSIFLDSAQTDLYEELASQRELPYFVLTWAGFIEGRADAVEGMNTAKLIAALATAPGGQVMTAERLARLRSATDDYIEQRLGPALICDGMNLVGFTLNYNQVYASIYCALKIRERFPERRVRFLFGGASAATPAVADVMRRLGIEGFGVLGEGERKLELIASTILEQPESELSGLAAAISAAAPGIYDIQTHQRDLSQRDASCFSSQFRSLGGLPVPELDEYFTEVRRAFAGSEQGPIFMGHVQLPLEGSRGCFASCDFCGINVNWQGFRSRTSSDVVDDVMAAVERYGVHRVLFMDNVCDTWAERYADEMIRRRVRIPAMMELRAHHPQRFWTKLAVAGVDKVQVGIEALAPGLIRRMSKGTKAWQNVLVQKWLRELGITSMSNLIIGHPRSTVDDVDRTKAIIDETAHLGRYTLSDYTLAYGSPLYDELDDAARRELMVDTHHPKLAAVKDFLVPYYGYLPPHSWYTAELRASWRDFAAWYDQRAQAQTPSMVVHRVGDERLVVVDARGDETREHSLEGEMARAHDACHRGLHRNRFAEVGLPLPRLRHCLHALVERGLVLELDGCFIALALRPRDELVHELYHQSSSAEHAQVQPGSGQASAPSRLRLRVM